MKRNGKAREILGIRYSEFESDEYGTIRRFDVFVVGGEKTPKDPDKLWFSASWKHSMGASTECCEKPAMQALCRVVAKDAGRGFVFRATKGLRKLMKTGPIKINALKVSVPDCGFVFV